jgi:CRP-like cAMP-binding protein
VAFLAPLDKGLHLRSVPLFGDLSPERIALLGEYSTEEVIAAGTVFQDANAPLESVRVIVAGEVSCLLADGKSFRLGPDTVLGVFDFFAGSAQATLSATTDVVALSIPALAIRRILEEHFDVIVHLFRGLGRTLIRALRQSPTLASSAEAPILAPHEEHPVLGEVERILLLRSAVAFRTASVAGLASLVRTTRVETFPKGTPLWRGTDEATWLGVIVHGVVECETSLRPGLFYFAEDDANAVGFLDALADDTRWYEARALTDVVVLTVRKDDLLDTLEDHFDMALACLRAFSTFAIRIVGRLHDMPGLPPDIIAGGWVRDGVRDGEPPSGIQPSSPP